MRKKRVLSLSIQYGYVRSFQQINYKMVYNKTQWTFILFVLSISSTIKWSETTIFFIPLLLLLLILTKIQDVLFLEFYSIILTLLCKIFGIKKKIAHKTSHLVAFVVLDCQLPWKIRCITMKRFWTTFWSHFV